MNSKHNAKCKYLQNCNIPLGRKKREKFEPLKLYKHGYK